MVDPTRTGLLIIRAWREDGSDGSFRAQIRMIDDISSAAAAPVNVADVDAAIALVRTFLEPWSRPVT